MAERAAYAVKERFEDDSLGTVFVSDAGDLNVREAIASGDTHGPAGFLVTEDPNEISALDRYEPLKRTTLQEAEKKAGGGSSRTSSTRGDDAPKE
jgi:hypothetical protein